MFALFLTLITLTDLNRFIGMITSERTITHSAMMRSGPLSDEWAALGQRYNVLVTMTDAAYAELKRRDDYDALTDVPMVCTACRQPVTYIGGDEARGWVGGEWIHTSRTAVMPCIRDYPVKAMVASGA